MTDRDHLQLYLMLLEYKRMIARPASMEAYRGDQKFGYRRHELDVLNDCFKGSWAADRFVRVFVDQIRLPVNRFRR